MSAVAVRRLKLAAPVEARVSAVQRIEEGLRLAAPAGQRVLLIRRLPLGSLPLSGPPRSWTARIEDTLRAIAAAAVHGLSPGAGRAAAVWFHSIEEMLAALLMRIARGESTEAWFWRAGAPEWDGSGLPVAASSLVTALGRTPAGLVATATAVVALAETGHLGSVATVAPVMPRHVPATVPVAATQAERAADGARAERLLCRLTPAARAGIAAALHRPAAEAPRAQWLVETALIAAAPELAAAPQLLTRTAAAWLERRTVVKEQPPDTLAPLARTPEQRPIPPATPRALPQSPAERSRRIRDRAPEAGQPLLRRLRREDRSRERDAIEQDEIVTTASVAAPATHERPSAAAGVLLLVGALARLGLPAWLDARPDLAADGFGRALLSDIARRHRADAGDPVLLLARDPPFPLWNAMLDTWRVGLDRWLRRRARIRLCDVAGKRGWLTLAEAGIDVRFAPEAADLRLRRLALDIDPGWVPWLGLTLHYHYRAEPLP